MDPAPAADIEPGEDAFVAWKKEEARADENEQRLLMSGDIYEAVRRDMAAGTVKHQGGR